MCRATSAGWTPRSDQTSSAAATATPASVASSGRPRERAPVSAVAKRERDEVEQLVEERAHGGQIASLLQGRDQFAPNVGGALHWSATTGAEGLDAEGLLVGGRRVEQGLERRPGSAALPEQAP